MSRQRKKLLIVLTALPYALMFLLVPTVWITGGLGIAPQTLAGILGALFFASYALAFAMLIYWTVHIQKDPTLSHRERIVWWIAIWLGNLAGLAGYLYFRIWRDEPLRLDLGDEPGPEPSAPGEYDDSVGFYERG